MKASQNAVELIKHYEGCKLDAYKCAAGKVTIGYGHTGGDVWLGQVISKLAADQLLTQDLERFSTGMNQYIKVPVNQSQYDALISFVFNLGLGAFRDSTLLKKLNAGDYDAVPVQLLRWDKAKIDGVLKPLAGLTKRRKSEAALFRGESVKDAIIAGKLT